MKLIILDRDGVINHDSEYYIKNPDEWLPIEGSIEAVARLYHAGYTIAIATNQSGVGRGFYDHAMLEKIHQKFYDLLAQHNAQVDRIFYCPHRPDDNCDCRKPNPGLLLQIAEHYQVSLANIPFVGDSYRDIILAMEFGCNPILVLTGNGEDTLKKYPQWQEQIAIYPDLAHAVTALLTKK